MKISFRHFLLFISMLGGILLSSCRGDDAVWTATGDGQDVASPADARQLVAHEVSVALNGADTRVGYQSSNDGLQLAWEAEETLGVYIRQANHSIIYAGQMTSSGTAGDRGARRFAGTVAEKQEGEQYVYLHPALTETQGQAATGVISFSAQSGTLGSTDHLKQLVPLVWSEGSPYATNHGYAVHLTLTFDVNPGTINEVTLQTMPGVGVTGIFPTSFSASTMSASASLSNELTLTTSGSATESYGKWIADAYLVCSQSDANVFRTKYDVKVEAAIGTFFTEYRSFPGQEQATAQAGLKMLANGNCYNLQSAMSEDVATTVINSTYKVNSLLGMWNEYGKTTDPFNLVKTSGLPTQLQSNIIDQKDEVLGRMLVGKSSQGTPTFTWDMVTKQCGGSYKQNNVTYNNIQIVDSPTEVFVTFLSEYAWSQNLLGYYHYSGEAPAASNSVLKTIIFPNVSKGGHVPYNKGGTDGGANVNPNTDAANVGTASEAPLSEFTTVQLLYNKPDGSVSTQFPAGTTIGFFMMRDPKASSSGHDEGTPGESDAIDHTGYQPRTDNTLLDWNSWRLFTNTAWNATSGNVGWWDSNCWNFFCSADVGADENGNVIPGLAIYGAKDDASHNYNYSFSAMLFMVSTNVPSSMQTANKAYFNLGSNGSQIIEIQK